MDITVNYPDRTFGTGVPAKSYTLTVSQRASYSRPPGDAFPHEADYVSLSFTFDPAVEGYTDDVNGKSQAKVTGARISLSVEEAEDLARLLAYSVQHARMTKSPVKFTVNCPTTHA